MTGVQQFALRICKEALHLRVPRWLRTCFVKLVSGTKVGLVRDGLQLIHAIDSEFAKDSSKSKR